MRSAMILGLLWLAANSESYDLEKVGAFSMSIDEFCQLLPDEQKALLADAFDHRLQHARNLQYQVLILGRNRRYADRQIGEVVDKLVGSRYRHWRLGDSYRMETERDRNDVDVSKPTHIESSNFDRGTGIGRSTILYTEKGKVFGRIDVIPDRIMASNRYAYWLDGEANPIADYLFRYLVEHRDSYTIECPVEKDKVRLTVPWQPSYSDRPLGRREFWLDPRKGFLPIKGRARWELRTAKDPEWRIEEFIVGASKLVGNVWMPTELQEVISASTARPGIANVWSMKVENIESGNVTPQDIEVPFPEGAMVVDAIEGVGYYLGKNGDRTRVRRLVGAMTPPAAVDQSVTIRFWFVLLNAGVILVLAAAILWRLLAKRRAAAIPPS